MFSSQKVGITALMFALSASVAAAQSHELVLPRPESLPRLLKARDSASSGRRDSIWNGLLIGAGIGAAGGAIWGLNVCGTTDDECFAIAGPAGIITGAGIGAAIGAIADALR
jgi:hypothetical protein